MTTMEKIFFGITGVGIAAGTAWLVVELAKTHPNAAKFAVGVVNEAGNVAADKMSDRQEDKPVIEVIKKGKDALADVAKDSLDEYHTRNRGWNF